MPTAQTRALRRLRLAWTVLGRCCYDARHNGCVAYDLHRSVEDPGRFIFTESWETRPLWEDHMRAPHLVAFGERQGEVTESWDLFVGEPV